MTKFDKNTGIINVISSMDQLNYCDGSLSLKIDESLEIHTELEIEIKSLLKKIEYLISESKKYFNENFSIEIDFDSFILEKNFLEKSLSTQKNIINNIYDFIQKGLFSDSYSLQKYNKIDNNIKNLIKTKIFKLIIQIGLFFFF
jgi:hypothetical protein